MTINRMLTQRIDDEIGNFYELRVWRKNTKDDLHVHMTFTDYHAFTRARDTVEQHGGTNVRVAVRNILCDLWFDICVKSQISDANPLDLIVRAYRKNRPEPNEWDP